MDRRIDGQIGKEEPSPTVLRASIPVLSETSILPQQHLHPSWHQATHNTDTAFTSPWDLWGTRLPYNFPSISPPTEILSPHPPAALLTPLISPAARPSALLHQTLCSCEQYTVLLPVAHQEFTTMPSNEE